jgi:hypothetical protein
MLTMRLIGVNDYSDYENGQNIGRILRGLEDGCGSGQPFGIFLCPRLGRPTAMPPAK